VLLKGRGEWRLLCRFSDAAGMTAHPRAEAAGVRKAPRHEVAGSVSPSRAAKRYEGYMLGRAVDGRHDTSTRQGGCLPAGEPSGAVGISAGTRSASTGGWRTNGRHRVERRQAASQNASTTFAFWHEGCSRGDLMFSACVISNSCAWQKWHIRQPLRD